MLRDPGRSIGRAFVGALLATACTYGPEEPRADVIQILPVGDSYRALVTIRHDVVRRPTGVNTFPDGGRWRYTARRWVVYLIDAERFDVTRLAGEPADDAVWESFEARLAGLEGDTVTWVRVTGCPKDGECYPPLRRVAVYRLSLSGQLERVAAVPAHVRLPGQMAARRPGERNYVRYGTERDTITARFEEGGPLRPLFTMGSDGSLAPVGAGPPP